MRSLALGLLLLPAASIAQPAAASTLERTTVHRIVDSVASLAATNYVFPDTGRMVAEHLRSRARAGVYDGVAGMARLADRLTADMQKVNGDRHLYVDYTAGGARGSGGPQIMMRRPGDAVAPDVLTQARRLNYEIPRVERLAGNVGYLAVQNLSSVGSEEAYRIIDAAMAFVERTDAMIIDLRQTRGGEPRMSDYVASYFFGPDSVRTLSSYSRSTNQTWERWTRRVTGKSRPDIPVFVLAGPGTASGAEDLAFIFKQTGRGTLVGERTAGAGRLTRIFPVGDGFSASISGGRTYDPRTGKEWERTGIGPDIDAPVDDALVTAHAAALAKIAATTPDAEWKRFTTMAREGILARASPVDVPQRLLREYAGEYDLRMIVAEDGRLWYKRDAARPREELLPINDTTFAIGEATRVRFVREGGRVAGMEIVSPSGLVSSFPRTK
jgi:hypothetical protein